VRVMYRRNRRKIPRLILARSVMASSVKGENVVNRFRNALRICCVVRGLSSIVRILSRKKWSWNISFWIATIKVTVLPYVTRVFHNQ